MANARHLAKLEEGVEAWNEWRKKHPRYKGSLREASLGGADLRGADFRGTDLRQADLRKADLIEADLRKARLDGANLGGAFLREADLSSAKLVGANLSWANLYKTVLDSADMRGAALSSANLSKAQLHRARLQEANLRSANLDRTSLPGARLQRADLTGATLVRTTLTGADLSSCRVYAVSAWDLEAEKMIQKNLVITREGEPTITVDNLEVAQFVYLLLNNEKIRTVINTVGNKGVLILGRFGERKHVLEAIRREVRKHAMLPIVFDFERPTDRDFSETVLTLAGMSRFIVADITKPKSVPLELELTVPNYMIPFVPILERGEQPFAMFQDLWKKHRDWVLEPLHYDSVEQLARVFRKAVIAEADKRLALLRARKAEQLVTRSAADYEE